MKIQIKNFIRFMINWRILYEDISRVQESTPGDSGPQCEQGMLQALALDQGAGGD